VRQPILAAAAFPAAQTCRIESSRSWVLHWSKSAEALRRAARL